MSDLRLSTQRFIIVVEPNSNKIKSNYTVVIRINYKYDNHFKQQIIGLEYI